MSEPTLKLVVAWSERRNLCSIVRDALVGVAGEEMQTLGDDATVVNSAASTAEIRDVIREHLEPGDHLLVTEFEVWSSFGEGVDVRWLLARGH